MAAGLTTKMGEALVKIAPPQNYKDLKVLDDMLSRHLGIGNKEGGGSGAGRLTIDLNVLNAKGRPRGEVVAAEIIEQNIENIEDMKVIAHAIEESGMDQVVVDDFEVVDC